MKYVIENVAQHLLELLRDEREEAMELPDDEPGRPHSHGETDNKRGLKIRALSIAITKIEDGMLWAREAWKK